MSYQLTSSPGTVIAFGEPGIPDATVIPSTHRWWGNYQAWLAVPGNTPAPYVAPVADPAPTTMRIAPITMSQLLTLDAANYAGMVYELVDGPSNTVGDVIRSINGMWVRATDNSPVM